MCQESTDARFDRFIGGLRSGDDKILYEFTERYRPALERLAHSRIDLRLRPRMGPESVAQSVCRTFLRRAKAGQFELIDGDALWGLLCSMTLTKVREKVRYHQRQKRAIGREQPLDATPHLHQPAGVVGPAEATEFAEQLQQALAGFSDEERQILEMRLLGQRQAEIAEALAVSERTVRRKLRDIEARLTDALDPEDG